MTMEGSLCRIIERNGKENDKRKRRRKRVGGRKWGKRRKNAESDEEIKRLIKRRKKEKATERDGIENEAWKYMIDERGGVEEDLKWRKDTEKMERKL